MCRDNYYPYRLEMLEQISNGVSTMGDLLRFVTEFDLLKILQQIQGLVEQWNAVVVAAVVDFVHHESSALAFLVVP